MRKLKKEKIISFVLAFVLAVTPVTVSVKAEDNVISNAEKYKDILGMYKTVDETIDILMDRVRSDEDTFEKKEVFFIKSKDKRLDGEVFSDAINAKSYEHLIYVDEYDGNPYSDKSFKIGDYYYQTFIITVRNATDSNTDPDCPEAKKEYEEKLEYVEKSLGLLEDEMCDYVKTALAFKYVVENVKYGTYPGVTNQGAYSALMKGKAVCNGYAALYQDILNDIYVNNLMVSGRNRTVTPVIGHAWNAVQLGDEWYYCDSTNGYSSGFCETGIFLFGIYENKNEFGYLDYIVDTEIENAMSFFGINICKIGIGDEGVDIDLLCTAPTCSTKGSYEIDCDYCKKHHSITIPEAHYYSYNVTKEATCTEDGYGTAVCRLCGDTKTYTIPAKGHRWTFKHLTSTCERTGYEKLICENCGELVKEWDDQAYGHEWSEWKSKGSLSTKCYRTCLNDNCYEKEYRLKDEYAPTSEEKEKKDRGLGIKAYAEDNTDASDNGLKIWKYYDSETDSWNELTDWCEVYSDNINGYALWNPDTYTFVSKDEYVTKKDRGYGVLGYFDLESRQWKTYIPWADDWQVHPKDGSYNRRVYPTDCDENSEKYEYYIEGHGWQNVYFYWDYATHSVIKEGYFKEENPLISGNNESGKEDGTENPTTSGNNNSGTGKNDSGSSNNNVTSNNITSLKNDNNKKISETIITKPAKTAGVKVTSKKKSLKVTWKKIKGVKKYRVQLCTSRKFKKGVITRNVSKNMLTIKKLKAKKRYYVRVCAVKTSGKKTVYGKWSKVANKKTK